MAHFSNPSLFTLHSSLKKWAMVCFAKSLSGLASQDLPDSFEAPT